MMYLKPFAVSLVSILVLDFIWLGFVVKAFNLKQLAEIGRIQNGNFEILYGPAILAYVFMALFLAVFIFPRLGGADSLLSVFLIGALGGLLVYGIFDMTNLAILNKYPLAFALADMAWGTFLFGILAVILKKTI